MVQAQRAISVVITVVCSGEDARKCCGFKACHQHVMWNMKWKHLLCVGNWDFDDRKELQDEALTVLKQGASLVFECKLHVKLIKPSVAKKDPCLRSWTCLQLKIYKLKASKQSTEEMSWIMSATHSVLGICFGLWDSPGLKAALPIALCLWICTNSFGDHFFCYVYELSCNTME